MYKIFYNYNMENIYFYKIYIYIHYLFYVNKIFYFFTIKKI